MRPARCATAIVAALMLGLTPLGTPTASAAGNVSYLTGDSEPVASLTPTPPPDVPLPNFDPDRDSEPGLLLERSSGGAAETDPTKYQEWRRDVSGQTVSATGFQIWAAPKDFAKGKTTEFAVFLMDCGTSCTVLDSASAIVRNTTTWRPVAVPVGVTNRTFAENRSLVVKVTVLESSDTDMWFAYATATYPAHLKASLEAPTTTTTTSPPVTTTSQPVSTSTTSAGTTSTTGASGPTTTTPTGQTTAAGQEAAAATATTQPDTQPDTPVGEPLTGVSSEPSPPGDEVSPTPGTDEPAKRVLQPLTSPTTATAMSDAGGEETDVLRTVRELEPEEGLSVAFATVAENITSYWQAAVATGSVAAALLWIGLSRRDRS